MLFELTEGLKSTVGCSSDVFDALQAIARDGYRRDEK